MSTITIPDPQYRYLEPYKNRTFQYDTKYSNLYLSKYVNNILRAVGNDVIIRGLEVTPSINTYKNGLIFKITAGSVIQDMTYIEIPTDSTIEIADIASFSDQYVILYTNWRYMETVYDNQFKFEVTLYNSVTETTLTRWDPMRNRIILGVYKFDTTDGKISNVALDTTMNDIILVDSNVILNSTFDNLTTKPWIPINSQLNINTYGGDEETPYMEVTPNGGNEQGAAESFGTKTDTQYKCSFYIKGKKNLISFKAKIINGNNIYKENPIVLGSVTGVAGLSWTKYEFIFTTISSSCSIIITKQSSDITNFDFGLEDIYVVQFMEMRKGTDVNSIKYIDGGIL